MTAAWQKKKKKPSRIICSCGVFMINFKQILQSWTNWCHLTKLARDFWWRGWRIRSLSWDPSLCLCPRVLESAHLPLEKKAVLRCYLQPSSLPSQWDLKIQWVDMSWQVSPTPFTLGKTACNVLGLHVSHCGVCKGCFVCRQSLRCQPPALCSSQRRGVL